MFIPFVLSSYDIKNEGKQQVFAISLLSDIKALEFTDSQKYVSAETCANTSKLVYICEA